jgi:hypothetical protein
MASGECAFGCRLDVQVHNGEFCDEAVAQFNGAISISNMKYGLG